MKSNISQTFIPGFDEFEVASDELDDDDDPDISEGGFDVDPDSLLTALELLVLY
jgi:hypothetical protein